MLFSYQEAPPCIVTLFDMASRIALRNIISKGTFTFALRQLRTPQKKPFKGSEERGVGRIDRSDCAFLVVDPMFLGLLVCARSPSSIKFFSCFALRFADEAFLSFSLTSHILSLCSSVGPNRSCAKIPSTLCAALPESELRILLLLTIDSARRMGTV